MLWQKSIVTSLHYRLCQEKAQLRCVFILVYLPELYIFFKFADKNH